MFNLVMIFITLLAVLCLVQGRHSCDLVVDEYASYVLNEYLVEKSNEKEHDFQFVLVKNELFGGPNLTIKMKGLHEKLYNTTLRSWPHLGMYPSHNNIRYVVETSYQVIMNIKVTMLCCAPHYLVFH